MIDDGYDPVVTDDMALRWSISRYRLWVRSVAKIYKSRLCFNGYENCKSCVEKFKDGLYLTRYYIRHRSGLDGE